MQLFSQFRPSREFFHKFLAVLSRDRHSIAPARFLSRLSNAAVVLGLGLAGLAASFPQRVYEAYPLENTLRPAADRPLLLIDANGEPFARRGDCTAAPVTVKDLPPHFIDALLAMEDRRFYSHFGIDPIGVLRAARRNYRAGAVREGGSTLTQQLVKVSYLTKDRTLDRKIEEAFLSIWLEIRLTKNQILERYISSVYFGKGCYGVRAAARKFFGKQVNQLSIAESAFMVALLSSPSQLINDFDSARKRAKLVIGAMVDDGRLSKEAAGAIQISQLQVDESEEVAGHYADWLSDVVHTSLPDRNSRKLLRVHTTFDPALQDMASEAVDEIMDKYGKRYRAGQAGLVAMRTDGRIVAMIGGRDWSSSRFNRAVSARRQPGSSFKTFVYLAAFQVGMSPDMRVSDYAISIDGWEPKNFGDKHRGPVGIRSAFASSINTVAVQLSEAVGRDAVIETARKLGIQSPLAPYPSISLGSAEVTLLEMTSAYAAIAAGAYPIKPWGVASFDRIAADGGHPPEGSGAWRLKGAENMRQLMAGVVNRGSGRAARLPIRAYGKTGTSQEHRDGWFIGFSGNLVVGVWVGNDDDTPMRGVTGGSLPARIWNRFMRKALKSDPNFERKLPRIAAFEAREPAEELDAWRLAAIENLAILSAYEYGDFDSYEHVTTSTRSRRERQRQRRARRSYSRPVSRDLEQRLNAMEWP
ncbi:MAG: PBP1A family penicillin-binding protein [Hyphomicrobiales bacterium]|nr:PBP1A family penicillin-binding protein [Hyphomicrobiales bacterium]